jgi:SUF system NifU family Fe-S assembly protein
MVTDLYQRVVLEHNRAPRRFVRFDGRLEQPTHAAERSNARCGDRLHCELRVSDGRIEDLRFDGEACAVAIATASMLGGLACGATGADVTRIAERLRALWHGASEDPELRELNALAALARFPERRHCAELPFAAIAAALQESNIASA